MSDKGNKPKDFDGTRSKYQEWIYGCHMYILANPTKYDTDINKTLLVLSYMREGTASLFAQKYYFDRELREYKATETKVTWGMFKAFLTELAAAFKDKSLEQKARQKLFTMKMVKCSADDFVMDYLMTARESGFDLESTINYFRRAIHPEILKQIYQLPEMLTTMDNWVKYTHRFDNQWRELQSIKSSVPATLIRQNNPFRYNSLNAPSSMNNSVVPMAIDSVHMALTDEERNKLRMEGGCFYCRQKGHMANQCPARGSSRIHEGSAGHVQQSSGKMGNRLAQAGGKMATGGGGYGRVFLARAQSSNERSATIQGGSMATTNPFRARLAARQAYTPGLDETVRQEEPEVSREEVQKFIGKLRWDKQEVLLQELSEGSK
ncbi:hypothetical protein HETIRDRAFT_318925 [Heterobasidion irregulare TC 32-1]|uniref:CCHC-type domain-containing protein n=1 Tax=Heterobasidion irregulare (strain TC 32-1) TaxID=747525 RepID=W4KAE2_HETIT|nr:uncharacterized protein HETIRDRAFT_318925 [Heterobasidion irregulare TC 32-1]ETW82056.1 hypothetical protein HETIRDRAFT_318925 [Heterobasidion irregulare TC 32-1]